MSEPAPPPGAVDATTQAFVDTIERLGGFADLDAELADGFLTAIACSPAPIGIETWLPLLAGDGFERCFADPADAAAARAALQGRLEQITAQLDPARLDAEPDRLQLEPFMLGWDDAGRTEAAADGASADELLLLHTGAQWVLGFGMGLDNAGAANQAPLPQAIGMAVEEQIEHVNALLLGDGGEAYQAHLQRHWRGRTPTRDALIDEALFAVQEIRLLWLQGWLTPAPRQVAARPGRNDPCPCGSGLKYKRCCGR